MAKTLRKKTTRVKKRVGSGKRRKERTGRRRASKRMRGGGGNTKASRKVKVKVTITFPDYISNEDRVVLKEVIQGLVTNDTELKGNSIEVRPCGYKSVTFLLNTTKDEQRIAEVFETLIFEGKGICGNQIWNTTLQVTEAADAVESVAEELQEQNEATEREKEELQNALQEHEFRMQELADNSAMLAEESAAKDAQLAATRVALDAKRKRWRKRWPRSRAALRRTTGRSRKPRKKWTGSTGRRLWSSRSCKNRLRRFDRKKWKRRRRVTTVGISMKLGNTHYEDSPVGSVHTEH